MDAFSIMAALEVLETMKKRLHNCPINLGPAKNRRIVIYEDVVDC